MGVALITWLRLRIALALACIITAGCTTGKPPFDSTPPTRVSWKPQLLYILNQPYRRLYLEVDAVEGCEPDDATLAKLKDFLAAHCDKPDGIEIVRRPVISRSEARGLDADALACKIMQGPGVDSGTNQAAFLEILFYDGKLTHDETRNSRTVLGPYITMNTSSLIRGFEGYLLIHEASHALGLVSRTNNAIGGHCTDPQCLMSPRIWVIWHLHKIFLGSRAYTTSQTNFCTNCLAELADYATQPPQTNMYFAGPVFVRAEKAYHVLSLPDHAHVVVGKLTEEDCSKFVAAVRAKPFSSDDRFFTMTVKEEAQDPAHVQELIDAAASDPLDLVRWAATAMCMQHGQFAGAVQICTRSIQEDPEDDMSYNTLAWIEAAAPDASLRDGRKAVADATKACELTQWKKGLCIDTLAAAYAESGDFQQAVKYEKMALRVGVPAAKQKALHERLSLYLESKPFRGQP